jgi:hypothetical protein
MICRWNAKNSNATGIVMSRAAASLSDYCVPCPRDPAAKAGMDSKKFFMMKTPAASANSGRIIPAYES